MKGLLISILLLFSLNNLYSQSYSYSYIDPCTGKVKALNIPTGGNPITVNYYGAVSQFNANDFNNGNFAAWINNVAALNSNKPCGEVVALLTTNVNMLVTQNIVSTVMNVTSIVSMTQSMSSIGSGMADGLGNSVNNSEDAGGKGGSKKDKKDGKSNNNTGSSGSPSNNNNNSGGQSNNTTSGQGSQINSNNGNGSQSTGSGGSSSGNSGSTNGNGNDQGGSNGNGQTNSSGSGQGSGSVGGNGGSANPSPGNTPQGTAGSSGSPTSPTNSGGTSSAGTPESNSSGTTGSSGTPSSGAGSSGSSSGSSSNGAGNSNGSGSGGITASGGSGSNGTGSTPPSGQENSTTTKSSSGSSNGIANSISNAEDNSGNGGKGGSRTRTGSIIGTGDIVALRSAEDPSARDQFRFTASLTHANTKNTRVTGLLCNYTTEIRNSNLTIYRAWVIPKSQWTIIAANSSMLNFERDFFNTTTTLASKKFNGGWKKLTLMGGLNYTMGNLGETRFGNLSAVGGGFYSYNIGKKKKISGSILCLAVYSPFTQFFEGQWWQSGTLLVPFNSWDYSITKKFKFNISISGVYQVNQNMLNYQILTGGKMLL